jgi:hypothetical protein
VNTLLIILAVVAGIYLLFMILQWASDRTYKPTISDVIAILEDCKEGRMSRGQFDEFSCVRIAYDSRLDAIREKFNSVVEDPQNIDGDFSNEDATALNDAGRSKIVGLIDELHQLEAESA